MRSLQRRITWLMLACFSLQIVLPNAAFADKFFAKLGPLVHETEYTGTPPCVCQDCAVETLAENIDWLEHHIDCYGSIVAKQPDIWGEARLTKHRDEYERMMHRELNQFDVVLSASIRRSDQSFLASSMALSSAVDGVQGDADPNQPARPQQAPPTVSITTLQQAAGFRSNDPNNSDIQNFARTNPATVNLGRFEGGGKIGLEPVIKLDQLSRYLNHLHELRRINEGDDTSDSPGYALNLIRVPVSVLPGKVTRKGFGAEITFTATPYMSDDLLPTTFRNLVINDITAQLRLAIVKMVERKEWQKKTDEELERQVRDLKEQIGELNEVVKFLQSYLDEKQKTIDTIETKITAAISELEKLQKQKKLQDEVLAGLQSIENEARTLANQNDRQSWNRIPAKKRSEYYRAFELSNKARGSRLEKADLLKVVRAPESRPLEFDQLQQLSDNLPMAIQFATKTARDTESTLEKKEQERARLGSLIQRLQNDIAAAKSKQEWARELTKRIEAKKDALSEQEARAGAMRAFAGGTSSSRTRRARHPLAPTVAMQVLDFRSVTTVAKEFCRGYKGRHVRWAGVRDCDDKDSKEEKRVHVLDAERWLQPEIEAAIELLSDPQHLWLWYRFAHPNSGLVSAIHGNHLDEHSDRPVHVENLRESFFYLLHKHQENGQHFAAERTFELHDMEGAYGLPRVSELKEFKKHSQAGVLHARNSVEALAWAVVVESALLNDRLIKDIRKTATARGCHCLAVPDETPCFFLPEYAAREESGFSAEYYTASKAF